VTSGSATYQPDASQNWTYSRIAHYGEGAWESNPPGTAITALQTVLKPSISAPPNVENNPMLSRRLHHHNPLWISPLSGSDSIPTASRTVEEEDRNGTQLRDHDAPKPKPLRFDTMGAPYFSPVDSQN